MNPRLKLPASGEMTGEQAEVCAEAAAGKRGKVPAPMIAWIRNPELARRAQKLGELLKFETELEPRLIELAILACARHWTSHQVWSSHSRHARSAGVDDRVIEAIAARKEPKFQDEREAIAFDLATSLLQRHRISDAHYAKALATFGERGTVELVAILGYYCFVALTTNAFALGFSDAAARELGDPDFIGGEGR